MFSNKDKKVSVRSLRVERLHLDSADSLALDGSDLDVSLVSPGGSPGVSNDVVLLSVLSSISNSGDSVVKAGSAGLGVQDTGGVVLEHSLVSLDGDGNWLLVNSCLELLDGIGWDIGVSLDSDLSLSLVELARS